jgi:hypothetical protein
MIHMIRIVRMGYPFAFVKNTITYTTGILLGNTSTPRREELCLLIQHVPRIVCIPNTKPPSMVVEEEEP